jgi:hypothetical protein
MAAIGEIVTAGRYAQGLTFQGYMDSIGENRARFAPHIESFRLSAADAFFFKDLTAKAGQLKVLAIGEDWCPDVHRGLPVMEQIAAAAGMELRFFPRDKNLDIMNLFLKEGKYQSIPVFVFFDGALNYLCHWIERPAAATKFQEEIRVQLAQQKVGDAEMRNAMREKTAPLTESWRQETVRELRELLGQAIAKR